MNHDTRLNSNPGTCIVVSECVCRESCSVLLVERCIVRGTWSPAASYTQHVPTSLHHKSWPTVHATRSVMHAPLNMYRMR